MGVTNALTCLMIWTALSASLRMRLKSCSGRTLWCPVDRRDSSGLFRLVSLRPAALPDLMPAGSDTVNADVAPCVEESTAGERMQEGYAVMRRKARPTVVEKRRT